MKMTMIDRFKPLPNGDPELTPSHHSEKCQGNGRHPGIECCCDNCGHFLTCWPDWEELEDAADLAAYEAAMEEYRKKPVTYTLDEVERELEEQRVERIVANCVANQELEGLICDEEDKVAVRRIVRGETTAEEEVANILAKYRKGNAE